MNWSFAPVLNWGSISFFLGFDVDQLDKKTWNMVPSLTTGRLLKPDFMNCFDPFYTDCSFYPFGSIEQILRDVLSNLPVSVPKNESTRKRRFRRRI